MKLTYRPEIDGLRAIAVIAVILYHCKITIFTNELFKGGFLGVDIFFVISGYLITSIILKELILTGSFSIKYFYERRIRRILPVLILVILVSLFFAWMYLLPDSFIDFSKSVLYSIGFISNIYFNISDQEYGVDSGLLKPFLHTWSLSVEEQFYIIFPIFLLLTYRNFKKYLVHIFLLVFLISLGLAEFSSRNYPSISFYSIHTRIWELIIGSILAYFEIKLGHRSKNQTLNKIFPGVGLILIAYSFTFFNDEMIHPSFYTLLPIIGVSFIIWFSNRDELITKILSTKFFVGIGLISYSLYLWHYPIFSIARVNYFLEDNIIDKVLFIIIIFFISVISYHFVEKPFRNKKNEFKKLSIIFLISLIFLIPFNTLVLKEKGFEKRFPNMLQAKLEESDINFFQKENLDKVVLIGDSHAKSLEYNLNESVKKNQFSLYRFYSRMYLKDFNYIHRKTKKVDKEFIKSNKNIDNFLKKNSNLVVIFHQRWSLRFLETFFDNNEGYKEEHNLKYHSYLEPINIKTYSQKERENYIKEGLKSQIESIINQGHKLIIVYPVPEMGFNVPYLFKKNFYKERSFLNYSIPILSSSYEVYKKRNRIIFEVLDGINNPNIHRVYPDRLFCNTDIMNRCVANNKDNIFYFDDDHLSVQASKFVVDEIMNQIGNIKLKTQDK